VIILDKPQIEQIYNYIKQADHPVTPKEIASSLNINNGTVRARISELRSKGKIARAFHGHYVCDKIHGGREVPDLAVGGVRVQNLHVVSEKLGKRIMKHESLVKEWLGVGPDNTGYLRVEVEFGVSFNRVNWSLTAPEGVDIHGLRLARAYVEAVLEGRGYSDFGWMVSNVEQFRDFMGIRLEGLKAVTLDNLDTTLEKMYQKSYGLRHEVRTSRVMGMDEMQALIQGGVPTMNVVQGVNLMVNEIRNQGETTRELMDFIKQLSDGVKANTEAINRLLDR
jgi:DNA-binding Lrp family transcriptional regulator